MITKSWPAIFILLTFNDTIKTFGIQGTPSFIYRRSRRPGNGQRFSLECGQIQGLFEQSFGKGEKIMWIIQTSTLEKRLKPWKPRFRWKKRKINIPNFPVWQPGCVWAWVLQERSLYIYTLRHVKRKIPAKNLKPPIKIYFQTDTCWAWNKAKHEQYCGIIASCERILNIRNRRRFT